MPGPDHTTAAHLREEAATTLRELCDRAGITRTNRHEQLDNHIRRQLDRAREGDPLFELRSGAPSKETLKKDLLYGVPKRAIRSTELRVKILDAALDGGGRYVRVCEKYWNALHPPQSGSIETWYQVTFPEVDPAQGPVGRLFTAIDITEVEIHGEDIHADYRRISPEGPDSEGLRWRGTGVEREGYRFLTFASLDPVRNRSFGGVALCRVGDAREEHYVGYYHRPADPAAGQPFQLERRRVAWFRQPPLGAWPRVALLDWDNTLHEGWTLVPWCEFLESEDVIPAAEGTAAKLKEILADYPNGASHDELAAQTSELYAQALRSVPDPLIPQLAQRFIGNPRRFRPYRWVDPFLRGLVSLGIAPVIVSGAPAEVLTAWVTSRPSSVAACFGLQAPGATSAALRSEFLSGIVPGQVNPATADGKQHLVDQVVRTRRRVVLGAGDSTSDHPLWDAAEYGIYVGTAVRPVSDPERALVVETPQQAEHGELVAWVRGRIGVWNRGESADAL